jgi:phosphatidylethanolamine-binding protein (PEBP) family uncharacterized protein
MRKRSCSGTVADAGQLRRTLGLLTGLCALASSGCSASATPSPTGGTAGTPSMSGSGGALGGGPSATGNGGQPSTSGGAFSVSAGGANAATSGIGQGGASAGAGGAGHAGNVSAGANAGGASGGNQGGANSAGNTASSGSGGGSGAFVLSSPDHADGATFADKFTCKLKGFNGSVMPELKWTAPPTGTKSYAITFLDVTILGKNPTDAKGMHWAIWNIPAATMHLVQGLTDATSVGAKQSGVFLGPCPNFGGGTTNNDTYEFTLYALATDTLTIPGMASVQSVVTALKDPKTSSLATAKLTGTSNASPP